jgi:hypothetical protein
MATGKQPYYDPAKFKNGVTVRISERAALEEFSRTWKFHHKLEPEQLAYAGRIAMVKSSAMYHGGDVLYQLEGVPGIWHEQLLSPG